MNIPDWFYTEHEQYSIEDNRPSRDQCLLELDQLENGIASEWKEQDVQRYLKQRPYLLVGKFRSGHGTFAFPEVSFGGKYYADWLVASGSSGGMMWEMIELECPQSLPFKKDGHFSKATRKGINQIQDWRNWLRPNLLSAETPRSRNGLGLFEINPDTRGLVVVGQSEKYKGSDEVAAYNRNRRVSDDQNRIEIISYNSFIESLRFRYKKPPYR